MTHQIELRAEPRTTVRKRLGELRRSGYVPGNVYGPAMESTPIQVTTKAFESIAPRATPTTAINLFIGSDPEPRMVYLQHVQWQFIKHEPLHLDFYAVNEKRHMRSVVGLTFRGESLAAKISGAKLLQPVAQIHVGALAGAMPESVEVDLSILTELDQSIYARDLKLPEGVTLLDDPAELIARVQLTRGAVSEESEAPAEESPVVAGPNAAANS
jgi:large subunit ribosomal protein L25